MITQVSMESRYVHTHTYACVCVYIYIYTHTYIHTLNTFVGRLLEIYEKDNGLVYYMYTYIHACIYMYIHVYIYIYTYIHTYTRSTHLWADCLKYMRRIMGWFTMQEFP